MLANGRININTVRDYQNNLIKGQIKKTEYYALSNLKTLPIRYLKQQDSNNKDLETGMKHQHKNSKFIEYHFVPVIESQMISPSVMFDDTKQGMNYTAQGELVLMTIDKPLPGDYFNFYVDSHKAMTSKELFKITDVTFVKTALDLNLFRISYETANVEFDYSYIEQTFFWNSEFRQIYSGTKLLYYKILSERKYLPILNKYYRPNWSYFYDESHTPEENIALNQTLIWIKSRSITNSTQLPLIIINGYDPTKVELPTLGPDSSGGSRYPLTKEIVWKEIPGYIPPDPNDPNIDPDYNWSWLDGKQPSEFAYEVWMLLHNYLQFIIPHDKSDAKYNQAIMEHINLTEEYNSRREYNQKQYQLLLEKNKGYEGETDETQ